LTYLSIWPAMAGLSGIPEGEATCRRPAGIVDRCADNLYDQLVKRGMSRTRIAVLFYVLALLAAALQDRHGRHEIR